MKSYWQIRARVTPESPIQTFQADGDLTREQLIEVLKTKFRSEEIVDFHHVVDHERQKKHPSATGPFQGKWPKDSDK